MTANAVAAVTFLGVVLYGVFGGADFGSGVWDLFAGLRRPGRRNPERPEPGELRRLVDHSIGPVWEANHVWLIFILVFLWTGFPDAFVALVQTMFVPLALAGLGIVLRGAGFAFRKFADEPWQAAPWGIAFAMSSLVTPFFLGTIAGGVASGRVPLEGVGDRVDAWLNPTSLLGGVLAVLTCAFTAAVFMARDADRLGRPDLAAWFRGRALTTGAITGIVSLGGIAVLATDSPTLFAGLTGRGLVFVLASAVGGAATMWLLWRERFGLARATAAGAVAAVLLGWGVAQYPAILVDEVDIAQAAGAPATMTALLVAFGAAAVLVVPALIALFVMVERGMVGGGEQSTS